MIDTNIIFFTLYTNIFASFLPCSHFLYKFNIQILKYFFNSSFPSIVSSPGTI
ncbi:hypothetical protein GLOIN_2v1527332, partial [Rhizophagus irregularis DAOM 181602=DAOM 197198]